jgi:hypothetical protein
MKVIVPRGYELDDHERSCIAALAGMAGTIRVVPASAETRRMRAWRARQKRRGEIPGAAACGRSRPAKPTA